MVLLLRVINECLHLIDQSCLAAITPSMSSADPAGRRFFAFTKLAALQLGVNHGQHRSLQPASDLEAIFDMFDRYLLGTEADLFTCSSFFTQTEIPRSLLSFLDLRFIQCRFS